MIISPTPWKFELISDKEDRTYKISCSGRSLGSPKHGNPDSYTTILDDEKYYPTPPNINDARLMALAPELLDMLYEIKEELYNNVICLFYSKKQKLLLKKLESLLEKANSKPLPYYDWIGDLIEPEKQKDGDGK
jgi:hypothetical protein